MPNRIYRGSYPPRPTDHALAHPYEVLIALGGLLACAALLASEAGAPVSISPTMQALPSIVAWLVGLSGALGNALVLVGGVLLGAGVQWTHCTEPVGTTFAGPGW